MRNTFGVDAVFVLAISRCRRGCVTEEVLVAQPVSNSREGTVCRGGVCREYWPSNGDAHSCRRASFTSCAHSQPKNISLMLAPLPPAHTRGTITLHMSSYDKLVQCSTKECGRVLRNLGSGECPSRLDQHAIPICERISEISSENAPFAHELF